MNPGSAYTPGREIARGGMGAILSTTDQSLDREVAMKVMLADGEASSSSRQRFMREALILARLEHPNIVPIHEMGRNAQGQPYYTMKLVKGRTLQAILTAINQGDEQTTRQYTLDRLLTIYRKVCDAVAFAHHQRIIHRDLKPENVMVGEFGEVLVMDWGLAKHLDDEQHAKTESERAQSGEVFQELSDTGLAAGESGLTVEGAVMGSPQYMPPEQAEGRLADIGPHSDIYSLGGILYAILTLRPPVAGRKVVEVLNNVKSGNITPPTHYSKSRAGAVKLSGGEVADASQALGLPHCPDGKVPASLSAVAMRALARQPGDRYANVAQITADVEAYQGGFATSAEDAGALKLLTLFLRRNKALTVAAALMILLTIGFMAKVISSERKATANAQEARVEAGKSRQAESVAGLKEKEARDSFAQAQIALAEAALRSGDYPGMMLALDACPPDKRDSTWAYLSAKRDSTLGQLRVPGFERIAVIVAVPGQSGQFALATAGGDIGFVDAGTGNLLRTIKTGRTGLRRLAFSGDGQTFAVGVGGEVDLHDTASGSLRKTLTLPAGPVNHIDLGHDASLLAVTTPSAVEKQKNEQLTLIETATGKARWQKHVPVGFYNSAVILPDGSRVIATSGRSRNFWIFNAVDGREVSQFPVYAMCHALHPDGKSVAIGTQQGEVLIVSTRTGAVLQQGKLHAGKLQAMAWTADGHLLTMGEEGKINSDLWLFRLWDPEFLALRATFSGLNPGQVFPWALNTVSGHLLTHESPPRIWRIPAGRELVKLSHTSEQAFGGEFLSDTVMIARKNYRLTRYDLATPGRATEMKGPELGSYCATHPASGLFAIAPKIGNAPFVAKIYATEQSALVEKLSLPLPGNVADLAFDADAARLAITYRSGRLEVFDVKTGASQLKRSSSIVRAAFAGPDGRLVALDPHTIKADAVEYHLQQLDGTTGKVLATVTNRFHVQAFAVSPDRKLIALGGSDRVVHLYDAETFREQAGFRAHDGDVGALTFHPTQPVLATASADGSVKLWEYRTGKLLDYFLGLAGNPVVLSFSPNGKLLMVDGQEHATRIYQIGKLDEGKAETVGARLAARAVRATPVAKVDRDGWTDVLSALTPEIVGEAGKGWRMDGGELFSPANAWATLPLPATLGGTSYQVRLRLRQLSPKDVFHLILPVGDQMVGFDLDGSPRSGFYTALLRVDGKGPMNAPGALHGKQVNDSGPHDLEATVRLADANAGVTITMKLDGRPLYEWTGPTTALSMYPEWNQIPRGRLAIGTWADDWVVSGLKVKRLDGK